MFTKFPQLFHPNRVYSEGTLEYFEQLAVRHYRRMQMLTVSTVMVLIASMCPVFQGAGPISTYLAHQWPSLFQGLLNWGNTPMSTGELVASILLGATAIGASCWELLKVYVFLQYLKPSALSDEEQRFLASERHQQPESVSYLQEVSQVRGLRVGDWRVAMELLKSSGMG